MSDAAEADILRVALIKIHVTVTEPNMSATDCAYACGWVSAECSRALAEAQAARDAASKAPA